jgi:hypothetical protein
MHGGNGQCGKRTAVDYYEAARIAYKNGYFMRRFIDLEIKDVDKEINKTMAAVRRGRGCRSHLVHASISQVSLCVIITKSASIIVVIL